jgi:peptide/nickel transport system substrate-binding protein
VRHVLLVAALCATACSPPPPGPQDPIVVAMTNAPVNLDPGFALDAASQTLDQLIYSSLLRIDDSLNVVPDLAVSFTASSPTTYVARIRSGVHFQDGREMTADDVAFTFRRFLDRAFVSGRKGAYSDLAAVDIVDRYTVAFRLRQPSASFPINLVMGIVPDGTGPEAARHPVGSGPYRLTEFVPDDHVTLTPFDGYYGGRPSNGGLVVRVVPDETMCGLELRRGSVDIVVNDLSPDIVHELSHDPALQVVTAPGTDYAYIGFNLRDPVLRDRRVRQAIAYAVDQHAIVQDLRRGLARPATGIVPPMSWAYAPEVARYPHDPARARALLDQAGYPDPDGPGPGVRFHLTLETSTSEQYRLQAAVIQQDLAEVGIGLDVRSYEFATLMSDVITGSAQMYTLQYVGITDPDILRRVFASSQAPPLGFNRGHYSNPEFDRVIAAATAATDAVDRRQLYEEAQRIIAVDVPVVSLWYKTNAAVAQADLTGIRLSPTADFGFFRGVARR